MSKITVDLDIAVWMNDKGQIQLFVGDDPKAVDTISLLDLVTWAVEAHKVPHSENVRWQDVKKVNRIKRAFLSCTAYLTKEIVNAK